MIKVQLHIIKDIINNLKRTGQTFLYILGQDVYIYKNCLIITLINQTTFYSPQLS